MVIRVTRDGHERHDVITELLKYLRYRYELSERALTHHAKLSADAMIGKLLEMWSDWLFVEAARQEYPEAVAKYGKDVGRLRVAVEEMAGPEKVESLTKTAAVELESHFLSRGDDGLLEYLRDWGLSRKPEDGRGRAVGILAQDVLNRRLFKQIGRADARQDVALSKQIYERFGERSQRRELEERVARWVEEDLEHRWQLVIWLPAPKMRQKIAEVLVDYNGRINHLDSMAFERANDIYMAHRSLWGVSVYVPKEVSDKPRVCRDLLSVLGEELGIEFLGADGKAVPPTEAIVIDEIRGLYANLNEDQVNEVRRALRSQLVAAHLGELPTKRDLVQRASVIAEELVAAAGAA